MCQSEDAEQYTLPQGGSNCREVARKSWCIAPCGRDFIGVCQAKIIGLGRDRGIRSSQMHIAVFELMTQILKESVNMAVNRG